jgi:hypothetical protein
MYNFMYNFGGFRVSLLSSAMVLALGLGASPGLLAITVPMATLPTGNLTCSTNTGTFGAQPCSTFSVTLSDAALATTGDGVTGLKFWMASNLVDNENPGTPTTILTFMSSGNATGTGEPAGIMIPFTYDFSLATSLAGTLTSYSLVFNIQQAGTSIFSSAPTFTSSLSGNSASLTGGNQFTTINPIIAGDAYTVTSQLTVHWSTGAGASGLTVTVPQNSFDTNSPTFVATPEPATLGSMTLSLLAGGLFVLRRRKKL